MDLEQLRKQFTEKVKKAIDTKNKSEACSTCSHDFKNYKQTLAIDNDKFNKSHAYFTVKGCSKCHEKRLVDYCIE